MDTAIIHWVKPVLKISPTRWLDLAYNIPPDLFSIPPARDEWSALECLQHLVDTERWVFPKRVIYLLDEKDFPAFDPDSQGSQPDISLPPLKLAEEFERLRLESMQVLEKVTSSDLLKKARHQELGVVSLSELLHEWAAHDLMHTVQAEQALMQPFISGCGPWQIYFRQHDIRLRGA